jgi:hypothetical protein
MNQIKDKIPYLLECKTKFFFLIHHLRNGGSSYNRAQSSKNGANFFYISNTVKICLGRVVRLFHCVTFLFYHVPRDLICGNIHKEANAFFSGSTVECF